MPGGMRWPVPMLIRRAAPGRIYCSGCPIVEEGSVLPRPASTLAARGIKTFLDPNDLTAGMPWPQALEERLRSARSVLVAIGRDGLGA